MAVGVDVKEEVVDGVHKAVLGWGGAVGDASRASHDPAIDGAAKMDWRAIQGPLVVHEEPGVGVDASTAQVFCRRRVCRV